MLCTVCFLYNELHFWIQKISYIRNETKSEYNHGFAGHINIVFDFELSNFWVGVNYMLVLVVSLKVSKNTHAIISITIQKEIACP